MATERKTYVKDWILHDLAQVEHLRWAVKHEELLQGISLVVNFIPKDQSGALGKDTWMVEVRGSKSQADKMAIYVAAFFAGIHHEVDRVKKVGPKVIVLTAAEEKMIQRWVEHGGVLTSAVQAKVDAIPDTHEFWDPDGTPTGS